MLQPTTPSTSTRNFLRSNSRSMLSRANWAPQHRLRTPLFVRGAFWLPNKKNCTCMFVVLFGYLTRRTAHACSSPVAIMSSLLLRIRGDSSVTLAEPHTRHVQLVRHCLKYLPRCLLVKGKPAPRKWWGRHHSSGSGDWPSDPPCPATPHGVAVHVL